MLASRAQSWFHLLFSRIRAAEPVVALERVLGDDEALDAWIAREGDIEWNRRAASAPTLIEDVSDGLGGEGLALVSVGESNVELDRAVLIEQPEQAAEGPVGYASQSKPTRQSPRNSKELNSSASGSRYFLRAASSAGSSRPSSGAGITY